MYFNRRPQKRDILNDGEIAYVQRKHNGKGRKMNHSILMLGLAVVFMGSTCSCVQRRSTSHVPFAKFDDVFPDGNWSWDNKYLNQLPTSTGVVRLCREDYTRYRANKLRLLGVYVQESRPELVFYVFQVEDVSDLIVAYALNRRDQSFRFHFQIPVA